MSATWTTLVGKYDWDASPQRGAPCRSPDERAIGNGPDKNPKSKPKGNRPRFLSLPTHTHIKARSSSSLAQSMTTVLNSPSQPAYDRYTPSSSSSARIRRPAGSGYAN